MPRLIIYLLRRFRPREGWPTLFLAFLAGLCVTLAASGSDLDLPASLIGIAAASGLIAGKLATKRRTTGGKQQMADGRELPRRRSYRLSATFVRGAGLFIIWALGLSGFVLVLGRALPPLPLIWRDGALLLEALNTARSNNSWEPLAASFARLDSLAFLGEALPRFAQELYRAPNAGRLGARLIAALTSLTLTWTGSLVLGIGLRRGRRLLGWSLPLLLALAMIVILGGAGGIWLVLGAAVLLALVLFNATQRREQDWQSNQIDYAEDLHRDALVWGGILLALILPLAAFLPFTFDNPLAQAIWGWFQPPSGLAELDRSIQRGQARPFAPSAPEAEIALSSLPAIELGQSLEQDSPDTLALQVRTSAPLPANQWPHYWRARVLSEYNGRSWSAPAVLQPQAALPIPVQVSAELIIQEVADARTDRTLLIGLPEIVGAEIDAIGERLPDGSLAALSGAEPLRRYRLLSQPPELIQPSVPAASGQPAPDVSAYLELPRNLPSRVTDLARTLARGSNTRYDTALALERYLRELPYSYEVAPLRPRGDAVDQFLFDMRQGYCTYYASAMAVMARTLGIPARVAVGYATGRYDPAAQTYTVHEGDAHAWPELYLDGRWLPFEPTPIRPLPAHTTTEAPRSAPAVAVALPEPSLIERMQPYLPGILVVVLLILAAMTPLWRRLFHAGWNLFAPRRSLPDIVQQQLEQYGQQRAVAWPMGATLREYATLLAPQVGAATAALAEVVDILDRVRYSPQHSLTPAETQRLQAAWRAVREGQRS
jgi:transglutaminase-like putative cysteine protease